VIIDERDKAPSQRRPKGHVRSLGTKKGNKRRGLRGHLVDLLDEESGVDEEEEDDGRLAAADLLHLLLPRVVRRKDVNNRVRVKLGSRRTLKQGDTT
jgi:hypothetical protein